MKRKSSSARPLEPQGTSIISMMHRGLTQAASTPALMKMETRNVGMRKSGSFALKKEFKKKRSSSDLNHGPANRKKILNLPVGIEPTESLKKLMKPAEMSKNFQDHMLRQDVIGKNLLKKMEVRRSSKHHDDSRLTAKAYERYCSQYDSLKKIINKRFRPLAPKDFRLYDDVDVRQESEQMHMTLHPFEEIFRRKLIADEKGLLPPTPKDQQDVMRSQKTVMDIDMIKKMTNKENERIMRSTLGIPETTDDEVESKVDDQPHTICCGLCYKKQIAPEDMNEFDESETESVKSEDQHQWCQSIFRDPTDEELEEMKKKYCEKSLNWFDLTNKWRLMCIYINESWWFDKLVILLILTNSVMLGFYSYLKDWQVNELGLEVDRSGNDIIDQMEFAFIVIFTIEAVIKIISMGFIIGKMCYLRDPWNWLDFAVVITGLLIFLPRMANLGFLRMFRLLRPLRNLSVIATMKTVINTLFTSMKQLLYIIVLNLFIILVFAIFGLHLWNGVIHFRCRLTKYPENGDWLADPNDMRTCSKIETPGSHQCEVACGSLYELQMLDENGTMTDFGPLASGISQDRDTMYKELNYGLTNFDDIGFAYLTIFQVVTLEGWVKIMEIYNNGDSLILSTIYFVLCVLICSYFLLNLTIAVMLDNFKQINQQNEDLQQLQFKQNQQRVQQLKNMNLSNKLRKKKIFFRDRLKSLYRWMIYQEPGDPPFLPENQRYKDRYRFQICVYCWKLQQIPLFNTLVMSMVLANSIVLATDRYPSPEQDHINNSNTTFVIFFCLELFVKLVGLRFDEWHTDLMNIFDLIVIISSVVELIFSSNKSGIISTFRMIRLVRLFKVTRSSATLKSLIESILYTLKAILNFLIVFALFIYVYALLGMDTFAGCYRFNEDKVYDPDGLLSRQNFDNMLWSSITVFQVLIGEQWNEVMNEAYLCENNSNKKTFILYFFLLVLIGKFVMLNLLLSIMLGNFEMSSTIIRAKMEDQILKQFEIEKKLQEEKAAARRKPRLDRKYTQSLRPLNPLDSEKRLEELKSSGTIPSSFQIQVKKTLPDNKRKTSPNKAQSVSSPMSLDSQRTPKNKHEIEMSPFSSVERKLQETQLRKSFTQGLERSQTFLRNKKVTRLESLNSDEEDNKQIEERKEDMPETNRGLIDHNVDKADDDIPNFRHRKSIGLTVNTGNEKKARNDDSNSNSYESDSLASSQNRKYKEMTACQKVMDHMSKSSLFIFHRESYVRKFFIRLTQKRGDLTNSQDTLLSQLQNAGDENEDLSEESSECEHEKPCYDADVSVSGSPVLWKQKDRNQIEEDNLDPMDPIQVKPNELERQNPTQSTASRDYEQAQVIYRRQLLQAIDNGDSTCWTRYLLENPFALRTYMCMMRVRDSVGFFDWTMNQWFEQFIYLSIFISIIVLVVDDPKMDPDSKKAHVLSQIDRIISIIFTLEVLFRIISSGFIFGSKKHKAYLQSGSNQIDFFVVIVCDLMGFYNSQQATTTKLDSKTLRSFKVLRCLRAMRPLRMISRSQGLKLAVGSLMGAMPAIFTGLVVVSGVVFIYAILGVSLFKGRFYTCKFEKGLEHLVETVDTKDDCLTLGGMWLNAPQNFDNFWHATFTLAELITTEGWLQVMYNGVDSREIDQQPMRNFNPYMSLYFISFVLIGNLFILNLFVGIVIDKFNRLKDRMCGYALMTTHQREWIETESATVRLNLLKKEDPPQTGIQAFCWKIAINKYFEFFIIACIVASTVEMSLMYYQRPEREMDTSLVFSTILTLIYNFEAAVKIIAFDTRYFNDPWNVFDFLVVIFSDTSLAFEFVLQKKTDSFYARILRMVKAIRIVRVFSLMRRNKQMKVLLDSLLTILPSIINVGSLILLMLFIFTVIGRNFFQYVVHQKELNDHANFQSFASTFILLVRCVTGENWNSLMRELAVSNEDMHTQYLTGDSNLGPVGNDPTVFCLERQSFEHYIDNGPAECGTWLSYLYFVAFILVLRIMMVNLFVAVVLEGFSSTYKEHTNTVRSDHFHELLNIWLEYDPEGTGWINVNDIIFLIFRLDEPLGLKSKYETEISSRYEEIMELQRLKQNKYIARKSKFLIQLDIEMIVPHKEAMKLLKKVNLPVYRPTAGGKMQCHFRDVVKRLCRFALDRQIDNFSPNGIPFKQLYAMNALWADKYPDLKDSKILFVDHEGKPYDVHRYYCSDYLVKIVTQAHFLRKMRLEQEENEIIKKRNRSRRARKKNKMQEENLSIRNAESDSSESMSSSHHLSSESSDAEDPVKDHIVKTIEKQRIAADKSLRAMKEQEKNIKIQNMRGQLTRFFVKKIDEEKHRRRMSQEFIPDEVEDYKRSTWWMPQEKNNYRMKRWVDDLEQDFELKREHNEAKNPGEYTTKPQK